MFVLHQSYSIGQTQKHVFHNKPIQLFKNHSRIIFLLQTNANFNIVQ